MTERVHTGLEGTGLAACPPTQNDDEVVAFESLSSVPKVDELLAIAAHELRTPAHSLRLTIDAMMRYAGTSVPELPPQITSLLRNAQRQAHHLARLTDVLLDVSRLEAQSLEHERVDLAELVADVVSRLALEGVTGRIRIFSDEPVVGTWSTPLVDQIVTNLVTNAVKYGEQRPIAITVAREGVTALLRVQDQGIGIPADRLAFVFQAFARAVTNKRFEGLGLGLFVVRRLAHALGGRVDASSELGVGSTFVVKLPLRGTS